MTAPAALPLGMAPAATELVAGREVALHYGDPLAEDQALHEGTALFDRSHRTRLSLSGPKAAELFTGLVTNDVASLQPGHGQYAAMLTAKGKIVADVRVFAGAGAPDRLLVDAAPRAGEGLVAMIRKFINPRLAPWRDETATLGALAVAGPTAGATLAAAAALEPATLADMAPYAHLAGTIAGAVVMLARVPELGLDAWELWVLAADLPVVAARLAACGAVPAGLLAWEVARIEAGRPEWGIDVDESTIPQEANFDELHAISYVKGCYIGQETVARVHFRGHVNRHLRHLRTEGGDPLPRGAVLVDDAGKPVGDVRSSVHSPRAGNLAIAMVRREVAAGATVTARWEGGEARATVAALPYVPAAGA